MWNLQVGALCVSDALLPNLAKQSSGAKANCQRDPEVICWPNWFLEACGAKANKPHIFWRIIVFWQGQTTTPFLKLCGVLALVPQASKKTLGQTPFRDPVGRGLWVCVRHGPFPCRLGAQGNTVGPDKLGCAKGARRTFKDPAENCRLGTEIAQLYLRST